MDFKFYLKNQIEYRRKLLENRELVRRENPDNLNQLELEALSDEILKKIEELDELVGVNSPKTPKKTEGMLGYKRVEEIVAGFIDWYDIKPTSNNRILKYVSERYPKDKYPRVLCVSDDLNCHLSRKLADKGYRVLLISETANKIFSGKKQNGGSLRITPGIFQKNAQEAIDWASVIVSSRSQKYTDELIGLSKPTIFSIAGHDEIANTTFNGKVVSSVSNLIREISQIPGITVKRYFNPENGMNDILFVSDPREKEER